MAGWIILAVTIAMKKRNEKQMNFTEISAISGAHHSMISSSSTVPDSDTSFGKVKK